MTTTSNQPRQRITPVASSSSPAKASHAAILTDLDRMDQVDSINGVVYGPASGGKTHLLTTAAEQFMTLIITYDKKDPVLVKQVAKYPGKIDVIDIPRIAKGRRKTISETTEALISEIEKSSTLKYQFVGLDGLSKLINPYVRRDMLAEYKTDDKHDPDVLNEFDYNRVNARVYNWIERLRNASIDKKFHLILTARERTEEISMSANDYYTIYYPDFSPELRRLVMYEFDFCYRLDTKKMLVEDPTTHKKRNQLVRVLQTTSSQEVKVKDRFERKIGKLTRPTVQSILAITIGSDGCAPLVEEEGDVEDEDQSKEGG